MSSGIDEQSRGRMAELMHAQIRRQAGRYHRGSPNVSAEIGMKQGFTAWSLEDKSVPFGLNSGRQVFVQKASQEPRDGDHPCAMVLRGAPMQIAPYLCKRFSDMQIASQQIDPGPAERYRFAPAHRRCG